MENQDLGTFTDYQSGYFDGREYVVIKGVSRSVYRFKGLKGSHCRSYRAGWIKAISDSLNSENI